MLKVKRLHPDAIVPTVAHPGEDLAYDLYAVEDKTLRSGVPVRVHTGIAAQSFSHGQVDRNGLLIRDRSSMASNGVMTSGGVIDHGYTGEIQVIMTYTRLSLGLGSCLGPLQYEIKKGDKIAQMVPVRVLTGRIIEVEELHESSRGDKGFGSSGK